MVPEQLRARRQGRWWRVVGALIGEPVTLPDALARAWPDLARVRWRVGGLPLRVGGWCLGRSTVTGITLGRTVFLAPGTTWAPRLLLHELRHVEQFSGVRAFALRYVLESLRVGYARNRYELDADAYAAARLERDATPPSPPSPGA
jgi:hypothetical protein